MPVPSSYNDITENSDLRDFVGWVWYDRQAWVPRSWVDGKTRIMLRVESAHYNSLMVRTAFCVITVLFWDSGEGAKKSLYTYTVCTSVKISIASIVTCTPIILGYTSNFAKLVIKSSCNLPRKELWTSIYAPMNVCVKCTSCDSVMCCACSG